MQAREVIGRTPDSSYFSLSDWKGCTVTRYETTAYEYVGERERERGAGGSTKTHSSSSSILVASLLFTL